MLAMMPMKGNPADWEARLAHLSDELAQARSVAEEARDLVRRKEEEVCAIGVQFREEHTALLGQLAQHEAKRREAEAQAAAEVKRADSLNDCLHQQGDLAQVLEEERARCRHAEAQASVLTVQLDLSEQRLREQEHLLREAHERIAGYAALELEVHKLREEKGMLLMQLSEENKQWLGGHQGVVHTRSEPAVHSGPPASLRKESSGSLEGVPETAAQAPGGTVLWDPPPAQQRERAPLRDQAELPAFPVFSRTKSVDGSGTPPARPRMLATLPKYGSPRQKLLEWERRAAGEGQVRAAANSSPGRRVPRVSAPAAQPPSWAMFPEPAQVAPAAVQPVPAAEEPAPAVQPAVTAMQPLPPAATQPAPAAAQPKPTVVVVQSLSATVPAGMHSGPAAVQPLPNPNFLTAPGAASPVTARAPRISLTRAAAVTSAMQDTVSSVGQGGHRLFKETSAPVGIGFGTVPPTPASPLLLQREMTSPAVFAPQRSKHGGVPVAQLRLGQGAASGGRIVVNMQGGRVVAMQRSPRAI